MHFGLKFRLPTSSCAVMHRWFITFRYNVSGPSRRAWKIRHHVENQRFRICLCRLMLSDSKSQESS